MKILDFLNEGCISLNLTANSKLDILNELVELLFKANKIRDKEEFFDAILCRETLGSTGVGKGVALPHAKTNSAYQLCLGFGISKVGIDYESIDLNKVNLFFIFASPFDENDLYLKLLSKISRLVRKQEFRNNLFKAKSSNDILEILAKEDLEEE